MKVPSFPEFMAPIESGGGPAGVAGEPRQRRLDGLAMLGQEEDNWCWSAVTQAILNFVHGRGLSQQDIASEHARRTGKSFVCVPPHRKKIAKGACGDGRCTGSCNDNHFLRIIMAEHRCFRDILTAEAAPTFSQFRDEIDAGRPVACRLQWRRPRGGHFVLVTGWTVGADQVERVHVLDPASNEGGRQIVERILPHSSFVSGYTQSGLTGDVNFSYRVK